MNDDRDDGRQGWVDTVGSWGREAQLSGTEEAALIRHYDDRSEHLASAMETIAAEYQQRLRDDGKTSADAWLVEAATELGRRDGEATRRLFESIP